MDRIVADKVKKKKQEKFRSCLKKKEKKEK